MTDIAVLRAEGKVLRVQKRTGKFDDGRAWESRTARLLLDDSEVLDVRVPREFEAPQVGADVDWFVAVEARQSQKGPQLRISLQHDTAA